jgi:transcriptional regulator with XRE-family HTH domain
MSIYDDEKSFEQLEFVLQRLERGMTRTEIAAEMGVTVPTVSRIINADRKNREQRRERERAIWTLRQKGLTHQEIADQVSVERSSVSKILKRLNNRFLDKLDDEIQGAKIEQWQQLDYIVSESLSAWERSKEAQRNIKRTQEALEHPGTGGTQDPEKPLVQSVSTTTAVIDQDGNPNYLKAAREALADMRKLLGIDAPTKIAATDPTGQKSTPGQVIIFVPDNGRGDTEPENNAAA